MRRSIATVLIVAATVAGCDGGDDVDDDDAVSPDPTAASPQVATDTPATTEAPDAADTTDAEQRYPDVLDAEAAVSDDGTWSFAVTISSPYDTPERYADGWRVLGPDGEVFGEHTLMHDHAGEQPFTRTQRGVEIPSGIDEVTIEARDQQYGYGGTTVTITLDR